MIDRVAGNPAVVRGLSYGRFPDGTGDMAMLPRATPGAANVESDATCPCCGVLCEQSAQCAIDDATGACEPDADEQCAALVLAEIHGLSILEIAEALRIPENTAKTRLFRAREKMREALKNEWRTS